MPASIIKFCLVHPDDTSEERCTTKLATSAGVSCLVDINKKDSNKLIKDLKKNNFDQAKKYLDLSLRFQNENRFNLVIFETLR